MSSAASFRRRNRERDLLRRFGAQRVLPNVQGRNRRGRIAGRENMGPFRRALVGELDRYRRGLGFQVFVLSAARSVNCN